MKQFRHYEILLSMSDRGHGAAAGNEAKRDWKRILKPSAIALGVLALLWAVFQAVVKDVVVDQVDQAQEQAEAARDAVSLQTDLSYPGNGCHYGGVLGWDSAEPPSSVPLPSDLGNSDLLDDGEAIYAFGLVRLHFTLPRTADLASIDVRRIEPRVDVATSGPPKWGVVPLGCGGPQYSRDYTLTVENQQPTISRSLPDGASTSEPFEPFTVDPGETVFLDYELGMCDTATVDLRFEVSYRASGIDQVALLPSDGPLRISTQAPLRLFSAESDSTFAPAEDLSTVDLTKLCA